MFNVGVTFEILEDDQSLSVSWSKAFRYMVFDVKMDFTWKVRWVFDGHKEPTPSVSTYAGIISCESV